MKYSEWPSFMIKHFSLMIQLEQSALVHFTSCTTQIKKKCKNGQCTSACSSNNTVVHHLEHAYHSQWKLTMKQISNVMVLWKSRICNSLHVIFTVSVISLTTNYRSVVWWEWKIEEVCIWENKFAAREHFIMPSWNTHICSIQTGWSCVSWPMSYRYWVESWHWASR